MKNVLILYNPNAGRKRALKYRKKILHFFLKKQCSFKFVSMNEFEQTDLSEFDTIVAAGGDGTVGRAADKLVNTNKKLAIIPCGTANLLAASLGIPLSLNDALKVIEKENFCLIDTLCINGKNCVLRAGFGYDSDIVCKTPQSLKNKFGYFAYFVAGILFALRLKFKKYKLVIGGNEYEEEASCLIVANAANMYMNIFSVGINSSVNDGVLNIFLLKTTNPVIFFFELCRIFLNIKSSNRFAKYVSAYGVTVKNDFANCHIDGEKQKIKGDIVINITPESLKVIS